MRDALRDLVPFVQFSDCTFVHSEIHLAEKFFLIFPRI